MIGIIGLLSDVVLAKLGKRLFPWERASNKASSKYYQMNMANLKLPSYLAQSETAQGPL